MKINREEFLSIVKQCMPGIDTGRSLLEGTDLIVFDNNWVHSYNDNISVSVPAPWEGLHGSVKANELFALLSKIPTEEVEVNSSSKSFSISGGKIKVDLNIISQTIKDHITEVLDSIEKWQPVPEDFYKALGTCHFAVNTSAFAGIFVSENLMLSTDEDRLNKWELEGSMDQFWIPDASVSELLKITGFAEYCLSKSWLHLKTEDGTCFSCKRLDDKIWPVKKFHSIMEQHDYKKGDFRNTFPVGIKEALDRSAILFTDIDGFKAIELIIAPKYLEVLSQNESGKYKETLPWKESFKKDFSPISLWIDLNFAKYSFSLSTDFYIKRLITEDGNIFYRVVFHTENFTHLLTTINKE